MSKEVNSKIHIKSSQIDLSGHKNDIEFFTEAYHKKLEGKEYITYKETEISGFSDCTSTLKIEDDKVTLIRFGSTTCNLIFDKDTITESMYSTEHGCFNMKVNTHDVKVSKENKKTSLYIRYTLDIVDLGAFLNELFIDYNLQ